MNNLSNPNSYIKKISVDLMAYDCVFKDVETKQLRKLNFYEKTIIMLLSKGVNAMTIEELIVKISKFLNIRESFVEEFILHLNDLESLHDGGNVFSLSPSVKFEKYNKDERIYLSNVKSGVENFNFLYISQLDVVTAPQVSGLKVYQEDPVLITENYIAPLANLVSPHLKKLEEIADRTMINDLAMVFEKDYLMSQLNTNDSYAKKSTYQVDVEYVFDEMKKQSTIASVVELIDFKESEDLNYFGEALKKHIFSTYVVNYDEPLFIKAKNVLGGVETAQKVLLNHKKDYMANEKALSKLDEKIALLNQELEECQIQIKEIEKNIKALAKSQDEKTLAKEQSNLNKKINEVSKKNAAIEKLNEDKKQIETENIIINHKIEDASKVVVQSFETKEFVASSNYLKKIKLLYLNIMKLPYMKLRTSIDNMVRAVLILLQQIEERCEEGIKVQFKELKNFTEIINFIFEYVYKIEGAKAMSILCDTANKTKYFEKLKKTYPSYTHDLQENLAKLLLVLSIVKTKNEKDISMLEYEKTEAIKDFFETNIKNKSYRKEIVFAFIDFLLSLDLKEEDWAVIEDKLK